MDMMPTHMGIGPASGHIENWYARFREKTQYMTLVYAKNINMFVCGAGPGGRGSRARGVSETFHK